MIDVSNTLMYAALSLRGYYSSPPILRSRPITSLDAHHLSGCRLARHQAPHGVASNDVAADCFVRPFASLFPFRRVGTVEADNRPILPDDDIPRRLMPPMVVAFYPLTTAAQRAEPNACTSQRPITICSIDHRVANCARISTVTALQQPRPDHSKSSCSSWATGTRRTILPHFRTWSI